jgi:predicted NBD/HSP70 family sugar kinase
VVAGLKLSEERVVGVLTDLETTVIASHTQALEDNLLASTIAALGQVVAILLEKGAAPPQTLLGAGVGLAGIVDAQQGILRYSPAFGWRNVPISDLLQKHIKAPVYIDNDVNTLTLTETWFGKGQGLDDVLTVTIGRGVGLGIVTNGQLYRGYQGGAGEFGHIVIDPDGPTCVCGNHGCLEVYASDRALLRLAEEAVDRGVLPPSLRTLDDLLTLAQDGNTVARAIYAQAGEKLAQGVANLINVFSPQLIIISGEGVQAGELLFDPMRDSLSRHVMPGLLGDTEIEVDVWNDDAWARGAAGLVLQKLFESPVRREQARIST